MADTLSDEIAAGDARVHHVLKVVAMVFACDAQFPVVVQQLGVKLPGQFCQGIRIIGQYTAGGASGTLARMVRTAVRTAPQ